MRATIIRTALAGTLFLMTSVFMAFGQSRVNPPAFEVASVKPNGTGTNSSSINRSGGRISLDNVSLRECIMFAYNIPTGREYELSGPAWLDSEKFDVAATFPPETAREQVREMLQTLLAERFSLKAHHENKKLKAYALVVGKSGPKLQKSSSGDDGAFNFRDGYVTVRAFSMAAFADRLSGPVFKLERPVVDMTEMQGVYDFTLEWAPNGIAVDGNPGASIFTAIQEQLGLKLETLETTVRILLVDRVNRIPTHN